MENRFSRTELILGKEALKVLAKSHVAVFGIGGVGGSLAIALARGGVGEITLIDGDAVSRSNINRQAFAFESTVGKKKVDVAKKILEDINPEIKTHPTDLYFSEKTETKIDFSTFDYVADAIDNVASKLRLIEICVEKNIPIISSMGTGNKIYPENFQISDIYKTSVCPLAKVIRKELRKRGIPSLKVLWSNEEPIIPKESGEENAEENKRIPGSVSFCPPTAGLLMAGEIIRDLISRKTITPFAKNDNETFV